ncbi:MAG: alginate export family protein [Flavobacteriaceae bacterium]|nr:alginate export family protein [Flavobacteriaceae bacterium]
MKKILLTLFVVIFTTNLSAQQFDLSAELRPRYENTFGIKTLRTKGQEANNFVSQRTRINFDFKQDKLKFKVSLQNVRVWGDVSTLSADDNATALHEAWGEAVLSEKISLKLGRQEISYDDQRIFGSVGWAQQARSHDAFLAKFTPNKNHKIDVGIAYNSDSQAALDTGYSNAAGYKTFQYAWYHGDFNKFGLSFLLLNTGIEFEDANDNNKLTVDFMQTVGPRFTYKSGDFKANAAAYFQTGKIVDTDVSASYFAANFGYKINDNFSAGIGGEYLSGTDMNDTSGKIKSFSPLFGTNHKFNGWMDYFYVGNHANNVGLTDLSATISYKKDKFSAKIIPHFFSSAADVIDMNGDKMEANLGTEIDFTLGYKLSNTISLNAGYSKMFATETMEAIKGGDKDANNSWGWVMFTFKPKLFSYSPPPVE